MTPTPDKRFLNFPLVLLSETLTDPAKGLNMIADTAIHGMGRACARTPEQSLVQLAYAARTPKGMDGLPEAVRTIAERSDVADFAGALETCFDGGDYSGMEAAALELLAEVAVPLSAREAAAVVGWLSVRDAAKALGFRVNNYEGVARSAAAAAKIAAAHAAAFGPLAFASVPKDYYHEVTDQADAPEAMRTFRMVCACRSIVGKRPQVGTVKSYVAARCIGAKTPAVAARMAERHPALSDELTALASRKRFDRILTDCAIRGFVTKLGAGRRVYLSITIQTPAALAAAVNPGRIAAREKYRKAEAAARVARGQLRGSMGAPTGTPTGAA